HVTGEIAFIGPAREGRSGLYAYTLRVRPVKVPGAGDLSTAIPFAAGATAARTESCPWGRRVKAGANAEVNGKTAEWAAATAEAAAPRPAAPLPKQPFAAGGASAIALGSAISRIALHACISRIAGGAAGAALISPSIRGGALLTNRQQWQ